MSEWTVQKHGGAFGYFPSSWGRSEFHPYLVRGPDGRVWPIRYVLPHQVQPGAAETLVLERVASGPDYASLGAGTGIEWWDPGGHLTGRFTVQAVGGDWVAAKGYTHPVWDTPEKLIAKLQNEPGRLSGELHLGTALADAQRIQDATRAAVYKDLDTADETGLPARSPRAPWILIAILLIGLALIARRL